MRRDTFMARARLVGLIAALLLAGPAAAQYPERENVMDDTAIRNAVEDELMVDPAISLNAIDVAVNDGVVTLSGQVPHLLARHRAARVAETVRGVRAVVNELEVDTPARAASAIRSDVRAALHANPATESYEVLVDVAGSVVTLRGAVESWQEKRLAGRVARGVRGVGKVINDIAIDYPENRTNDEIRDDVKQALRWDNLVDHQLIEIDVRSDEVELSGTVGSAAEKRHAVADAWVTGVESVDATELEVARWARDADLRRDKYAVKGDAAIRDAVRDALLYDPQVNPFDIQATVDDGVVNLRGVVDNLRARRSAGNTARNTVGVLSVNNRIRVRAPDQPAPADLAAAVRAALERDPYVSRFDISVAADARGVVTLRGTVDTFFEKQLAGDIASGLAGVTDVRNHLAVEDTRPPFVFDPYVDDFIHYEQWYEYEPGYALTSDAEIEREIRDELWWSPFVDAEDVEVTVDDGEATLEGTVESTGEARAAVENAFEGGAVRVDNDLVVEGG